VRERGRLQLEVREDDEEDGFDSVRTSENERGGQVSDAFRARATRRAEGDGERRCWFLVRCESQRTERLRVTVFQVEFRKVQVQIHGGG